MKKRKKPFDLVREREGAKRKRRSTMEKLEVRKKLLFGSLSKRDG